MSIRLNKAISELNIGLQTAVDFLKKRSELGNAPEGPNSKLTDEQYKALVEAYKSDKEERTQAEKLLQKKPKEKKRIEKKNRAPATEIHSIRENRPRQYRQEAVGTICCLSFKTRRKQGKSFCRKPAGKRGQSSCAAAKDNGPTAAK